LGAHSGRLAASGLSRRAFDLARLDSTRLDSAMTRLPGGPETSARLCVIFPLCPLESVRAAALCALYAKSKVINFRAKLRTNVTLLFSTQCACRSLRRRLTLAQGGARPQTRTARGLSSDGASTTPTGEPAA